MTQTRRQEDTRMLGIDSAQFPLAVNHLPVVATVMSIGALVLGALTRHPDPAARLGGQIRHDEVRPSAPPGPPRPETDERHLGILPDLMTTARRRRYQIID